MYEHHGMVTVLPPPEGYEVDFENPQHEAVYEAYYFAAFGFFFSSLFLGQRLYVKISLSNGMQVDDYLLVFAWILSMVTVFLCVRMFAIGAGGIHAWEVSIELFNVYLMAVYLAAWIFTIAASLAKSSLLVFYLRLSPQVWFHRAIWATMVFIAGYTISLAFAVIFACNPIRKSWDVRVEGGQCINQPVVFIATAVANIIGDVILFCLPIPMLYNLQISKRQKIGLVLMFAVGSMTVVTTLMRVLLLPQMLSNPDATWTIRWASVWVIVEANLLVICAALPTLRRFLKHVCPFLVGETSRSGSGRSSGPGLAKPASNTIVTIGSLPSQGLRRDKHAYSQFDTEEIHEEDEIALQPVKASRRMNISGGHHPVQNEGEWSDSNSERAIVSPQDGVIFQTTTVKVEYS